jgi:DNA-binding MarR family transcriptional regulator
MAEDDRFDLLFLLNHVSHVLSTEVTAALAAVGITPRDQCVLVKALAAERTQSEIAEMSDLDKTTMVVTVDGLEKRGLAERRPAPTDRRARIVSVTPEGEKVATEAEAIIQRVYEDVLATLPPAQRKGLVTALEGLTAGRLAEPVACESPPRRRVARAS